MSLAPLMAFNADHKCYSISDSKWSSSAPPGSQTPRIHSAWICSSTVSSWYDTTIPRYTRPKRFILIDLLDYFGYDDGMSSLSASDVSREASLNGGAYAGRHFGALHRTPEEALSVDGKDYLLIDRCTLPELGSLLAIDGIPQATWSSTTTTKHSDSRSLGTTTLLRSFSCAFDLL